MVIRTLAWTGTTWRSSYIGKLTELGFRALGSMAIRPANPRENFRQWVSQVYFTGVEAVPLVALLAVVIGSATILQAAAVMPRFGATDYFGGVMVIVVMREIGPLFTAFLVAGRTGSGLSTYLGNMKVNQEVDALRVMGIDPVRFLVLPAFTATLVSLFALTLIFHFTALFGGFAVVKFLGLFSSGSMAGLQLSLPQYLDRVTDSMGLMDAILVVAKPMCFGTLISLVASHHGLSVKADAREVPKATTRGVVHAFAGVILLDALFALPFLLTVEML
jgi:phospholipid/cholesterol/gamma-HCH transport system permease protein